MDQVASELSLIAETRAKQGINDRIPFTGELKSANPAVESFMERTGPQPKKLGLWDKFKKGWKDTFIPFHELQGSEIVAKRGETEITKTRQNAPLIDLAGAYHTAQRNWRQTASRILEGISHTLSGPKEIDFMRRMAAFKSMEGRLSRRQAELADLHARRAADLEKAIADFEVSSTPEAQKAVGELAAKWDMQIESASKRQTIPIGLDEASVRSEVLRLEAEMKTNPSLDQAWRSLREVLDRGFKQELVDRNILPAEGTLTDYYPHVILDYALSAADAVKARAPKRGKPSHLKREQGTARDFSTDFMTVIGKYIAETGETLQKRDILKEMASHADIRRNPRLGAEGWQEGMEIPEGYTRLNLGTLNERLVAKSLNDRLHLDAKDALASALHDQYGIARDQLQAIMDMVGRSRGVTEMEYIIPKDVHGVIETMMAPNPNFTPIERFTRKANEAFKTLVIHKMPIQQNLRNASGDIMKGIQQYGKEFLQPHLWQKSFDDVSKVFRDQVPSEEYRISQKHGLPGSGRVAVEAADWSKLDAFRRFLDDPKMSPKSLARNLLTLTGPKLASAREDLIRQVVYRMNLERHDAGKPMLRGIADPERVKGLVDYEGGEPYGAASHIAKTGLGDYNEFTPSEDRWRRGLAPFYSWIKINTFLYPYRTAKAIAKGDADISKRTMIAGLGATMAVMAAIRVWNSHVMGDAEEMLPEQFRTGNHLILPDPDAPEGQLIPWLHKAKNGKMVPYIIAIPDPIDDILQFYGFDGVPADVAATLKGHMSWGELLERYKDKNTLTALGAKVPGVAAPARAIASALGPVYQMPVALGGANPFPDPFNFRQVPEEDRATNFLRSIGLSGLPITEAKQGANILDPVGQLGLREPIPSKQPYYIDELERKRFQLDADIQDIEGRIDAVMGGVRDKQLDKEGRRAKMQKLKLLRDGKIAEIRRLSERLRDINRTRQLSTRQ